MAFRDRHLVTKVAALSALGAAAWIAYSYAAVPHRLRLPPALPGDRRQTNRRSGPLSYYVAGDGAPLLLIHSINAAASAYEVRPIYERMRKQRRVYALDLPGFGFSDRSERRYDARLYTNAIHDMVDEISHEIGPQPIDALALSLPCEHLARVAAERPERFASLTLVTPTGFEKGSNNRRAINSVSRDRPMVRHVLKSPLWRRPLFDLLTSRPSMRLFLGMTWGGTDIDEGLLAYDYLTAHQPGAENAAFDFVSGAAWTADVRDVYERLSLPVWVPYGTRTVFEDMSEDDWTRSRPNWRLRPFETGAFPHFQAENAFISELTAFVSNSRPKARTPSRPAAVRVPA